MTIQAGAALWLVLLLLALLLYGSEIWEDCLDNLAVPVCEGWVPVMCV